MQSPSNDASDVKIHSQSIKSYAEMQRSEYDQNSQTRADAEAMVHPKFALAEEQAPLIAHFIYGGYASRFIERPAVDKVDVLDVGCGVGRMMVAFEDMGVRRIDGADISEQMLKHARVDSRLKRSQLFLTSGQDLAGVPSNQYDIVYSTLCFHHICMRQTRIQLLSEIARCLKDDGYLCLEFKVYPGVDKRQIPANHAAWHENRTARRTNSMSDVWITPDALGEVFADFHLFFADIQMTQISMRDNYADYNPDFIYQYPFDPFFISGSKGQVLKRLVRPREQLQSP